MKGIIAILIVTILLFGCTGSQDLSQQEVEKILNGADKKNISVNILLYHGEECPHCKKTIALLNALNKSYDIHMTLIETWHNEQNAKELVTVFDRFKVNPSMQGVPVMLIEDKMLVVGEISIKNWIKTLENCGTGKCPSGVYTDSTIPQ